MRVLGAGELTSPFGVLDAVIDGAAEMAYTVSFFWAGRVPAASYFTTMPFGLSPLAHSAWVRFGGGQALWDEAYAPLEVKPLMAGNSGANMAGWFKAPLQSLASLGGVKIRLPESQPRSTDAPFPLSQMSLMTPLVVSVAFKGSGRASSTYCSP